MKTLIWITLGLVVVLSSCGNRREEKDGELSEDALKELFAREKANEEQAKYGSSAPITVISDPKEVAKIRKEIEQKIEKKKREDNAKTPASPALLYKKGDKTMVPKLIAILQGSHKEAREEVYDQLDKNYDDPADYLVKEPELLAAIYKNLNNPEDEKSVIQLAGYMKMPGYGKAFEERLLSGRSTDMDRLVFWLGKEGKSTTAVGFVEKQMKRKDFDFEGESYCMDGLAAFAENGDAKMKERVFLLCLDLYNSKSIGKENFDKMKKNYSSSNPAEQLTGILFEYGDKRVVPIAEEYLKKGIREEEALEALIRLEGAKYKPQVLALLADTKKFERGLEAAQILYKAKPEKEIPEQILLEYEAKAIYPGYLTERVVKALAAMKATEYLEDPAKVVKNAKLVKDIKAAYFINKSTPESIAEDMYEFGLVDKASSDAIAKRAKEMLATTKGELSGDDYLSTVLEASGINHWFDAETGMVPVDYDELIRELAKRSNKKLENITVWMDATGGGLDIPADAITSGGEVIATDDQGDPVTYTIYVLANDRAYMVSPEDIGDWYDVAVVVELLNKVMEDSGQPERYVFLDTGDQTAHLMFGPEGKIKRFAAEYRLENN